MRVLLSTYGSRGDLEPMAALAAALQAMGAEAVVSAPGDPEFVELVARAGAPFAPAFMPVRDWIASARQAPADIQTYGARMIGPQYAAIDKAAEGCDAVVATGLTPSCGAAQCVAEKRGLAYAHVSLCPLYLPSHHQRPFAYPQHPFPPGMTDAREMWAFNAQAMNALFAGNIDRLRASLGLPPVGDVRAHVFTRRPFLASDPVLWPWRETDLCDPVQTGAWILPDERPLGEELEAFLDAGAPPVYVGFGSIALPSTKEAGRIAIDAVRALGRRLIVQRGWAELGPFDDAPDCLAIGETNQQALFRRVAAVVHHGGAGTTTTAARAGAPQVIAPQIVDQPFWAARVAELGVGAAHDGPTPNAASLSAALEIALQPDMRTRAAALAAAMPTDGASVAARMLMERVG